MDAGLDLYHLLRAKGLSHSLRHYSREWLGSAENYACLRGDRGPSARAFVHLFRRLWSERRLLLAARVAHVILRGGFRDGG